MGLAISLMFIDKVDLYIPLVRKPPEIILPYQTIKIDGRRRTRVHLNVTDFRNCHEFFRQGFQHSECFLDGGALRHIYDDLKLGFIVEGQHFHHYRGKYRQ